MSSSVPPAADVVVVGGGITGLSTLYYLATAGIKGVLFERDLLGSGSTSKAAGGIRAQFSDELNVRIMVAAIKRWENFAEELETDIGFKQWGYLFLLAADHLEGYRRSAEMQRSHGVPVEEVDVGAIAARLPGLESAGIEAGMFSPTDGYATPEAAVAGYAAASRKAGADIFQSIAVNSILTTGNQVTGVETSAGTLATENVVVACGVWTNDLLQPLGVELPISPERRTVFLTADDGPLPHALPLTIDVGTGFYFHREGEGLLIAGRHQHLEDLGPSAVTRLPFLADIPIRPGWHGFYAVTPDHNPVIEASRTIGGLSYAAGFSGHGFMQAPVVGDYLASLVGGHDPPLDLSPFSLDRFDSGRLRPETNVI